MWFETHEIGAWLAFYALHMPLGWFVFWASILEEVVSPIPAMLVTGLAGSVALVRHEAWWYLLMLAALASLGKTLGAWLYYSIGAQAEKMLIGRVGKWFGVTHADIERVGQRFTGQHWKDAGLLFFTRLLPFMPTTPFSVAAGIFRMDIRVYLATTALGYLLKDTGYILAGYFGVAKLSTLWRQIEHVKMVVDAALALVILVSLFVLYRHRHRGRHVWHRLCRWARLHE